jgi:hypothetical protein
MPFAVPLPSSMLRILPDEPLALSVRRVMPPSREACKHLKLDQTQSQADPSHETASLGDRLAGAQPPNVDISEVEGT